MWLLLFFFYHRNSSSLRVEFRLQLDQYSATSLEKKESDSISFEGSSYSTIFPANQQFQFLKTYNMHEIVQKSGSCSVPKDRTMTLSLSITVGTLWATVITVQLENSSLMILCRITSVAESMDAVASSSTRILFLLSNTLPRQNCCLCPTLQLSPSSLTVKMGKKE